MKPLYSLDHRPHGHMFNVGEETIGSGNFTQISGPCAVESYDQFYRIAKSLKGQGISIIRGGAFKPRTSPYSFQGLGEKGLEIQGAVKRELGVSICSEVMGVRDLNAVANVADILQIGARNMQNFDLLKEVGATQKPVLLKRSPSATIDELLGAAEYILTQGNSKVILCERGLRHFDSRVRNLIDISAVPVLKQLTYLPVIVDPSHASGDPRLIAPLTKAALAAGADGSIIEVHDRAQEALCDGAQAMHPNDHGRLMEELSALKNALLPQSTPEYYAHA